MQDLPQYDSVELALNDLEQAREDVAYYVQPRDDMIKRSEMEMNFNVPPDLNTMNQVCLNTSQFQAV